MSVDRRFFSLNFSGSVPIEFRLSEAELTTLEAPPPLFIAASRILYLPMIQPQIRAHFTQSTAAVEDELWFEFDGEPLRWQFPIGVLADFLAPATRRGQPIPITVHFQRFPAKKLSRCKNLFALRQHYFNSLKEAAALKFGSVKSLIGGAASDHSKLWESLANLKEENFISTICKIFSSVTSNPIFQSDPRSLAVRFLFRGFAESSGDEREIEQSPIQRPIEPKISENGIEREISLIEVIRSLFPHLIGNDGVSLLTGVSLLIQGVEPPLEAPIVWLAQYFSHPDLFLYITIMKRAKET